MHQSTNPWEELKEALRQQALALGFDVAGFAPPRPPPHGEYFSSWLAMGGHGDMAWMERHPERRTDPATLMAGLGVVLVLGINHRPPWRPDGIAAYACHTDYHALLKKRVQELGCWLTEKVGRPVAMRACVDTAPLLEKPLAVAAGLGWQGKNTLLVARRFGCWLMLAELLVALPIPPDSADGDHCGECDRCLRACPTDALRHPYRLDGARCLAFVTVESHGPIPHDLRAAMGTRLFGCDACLTACPWNRFTPLTREPAFLPRPEFSTMRWGEWATLDADGFADRFRDTPLRRLGVIRFLRNVATALGNLATPESAALLEGLSSHADPLVRGHAAWGLGRNALLEQSLYSRARAALLRRAGQERDEGVLAEIESAYANTFNGLLEADTGSF